MKNQKLSSTLFGMLLGSALAAMPVAACAQSSEHSVPVVAAAEAKAAKTLAGKVEAKSDTSLVVDGHTVKLTQATRYTKAGTPAGGDDVKVGDKVTVTTADDGETALAVDVTAAE